MDRRTTQTVVKLRVTECNLMVRMWDLQRNWLNHIAMLTRPDEGSQESRVVQIGTVL